MAQKNIRLVAIKESSKDSKEMAGIYLYVSAGNQRKHFALGFHVEADKFDKDNECLKQGSGYKYTVRYTANGSEKNISAKEANAELSSLLKKAQDIAASLGSKWNAQMFKEQWEPEQKRQDEPQQEDAQPAEPLIFAEYMADLIKTMQSNRQAKNAMALQGAYNSFKEYDSHFEERTFEDITADYVNAYISWCEDKQRNHGKNTISIRVRAIRSTLNQAWRDDAVNYHGEGYPFGNHGNVRKVCGGVRRTKANVFLTRAELTQFAAYECSTKHRDICKHLFLASVRLRGINWKDMAMLTKDNIKKQTSKDGKPYKAIVYQRSKTKDHRADGAEITIKITDSIQRELDWFRDNTKPYNGYLFPIIMKTVKATEKRDKDTMLAIYLDESRGRCNDALKLIAGALNLNPDITFYSARHSFAMAMREQGASIEQISQALGHSDIKVTMNYLAQFDADTMADSTELDF